MRAEERSVQILKRSAIESGKVMGNDDEDEEWSIKRRRACAEMENKVEGVRSWIEETSGGIVTPELESEFNRISCDSSISPDKSYCLLTVTSTCFFTIT